MGPFRSTLFIVLFSTVRQQMFNKSSKYHSALYVQFVRAELSQNPQMTKILAFDLPSSMCPVVTVEPGKARETMYGDVLRS